jgi:5-hydroxyisourate hydrolase
MNRISTHVLDTVRGKPAPAVPVRLDFRDASGDWRRVASSETDTDGRCAQLLPAEETLISGFYRITFDTEAYFTAHGVRGLYPLVQITFHARGGESDFHIPLLLSPNGYTTYRGS